MQFKKYPQGRLDFQNIKAEYIMGTDFIPKFKFENNYYFSEDFIIQYFKSIGFNAFFAENEVWVNLLVYLFNNELKRTENQKLSLSNINHYLYDDDYFRENKDKFDRRFDFLKNTNLSDEIKNCPHPNNKLIELCNHLDNNKLLIVLYDLISDLNMKKKGFPDLFVFNDEKSFFCEVKGNTDVLSYVQIKKHEVLLNAGIDVIVFSINKNAKWGIEQREKYFNEALFRRGNFIDNYDSKIYVANKVYNELKEEGIMEFKDRFLKRNDMNSFISYLNIIKDFSFEDKVKLINSDNQFILDKSIEKGKLLKDQEILKNARILEDKKKYSDAIAEYSKVNTFNSYKRIIYCHRKLRDYESELNLIYKGINNFNFTKKEKRFLKNRLRRFFKNKNDFSVIETHQSCPYCGCDIVLNKFKTRNKIKFFTCSNNKCYWYGGFEK